MPQSLYPDVIALYLPHKTVHICCMAQAIRLEGSALDISALSLHGHLIADCAWKESSHRTRAAYAQFEVLRSRTSTQRNIGQSDNHFQKRFHEDHIAAKGMNSLSHYHPRKNTNKQ